MEARYEQTLLYLNESVYDKVKWHIGDAKKPEDPKAVINRFLKAFVNLDRKNMLTPDGQQALKELQMIKQKNFKGADTTDVSLTSSDLTPEGIKFADKQYKQGIIQ